MVVSKPAPVRLHQGEIFCLGFRDQLTVSRVPHIPSLLADLKGEGAAVNNNALLVVIDLDRFCGSVDLKRRVQIDCAKVMIGLHADDLIHGGSDDQRQIDTAECVTSLFDADCRGADRHLVRLNFCEICLLWRETFTAFLLNPTAITEFHHYLFSAPVSIECILINNRKPLHPALCRCIYVSYHILLKRK